MTDDLGIGHFHGILLQDAEAPSPGAPPDGLSSYPRRWILRYAMEGRHRDDPVLHLARRAAHPFFWEQVPLLAAALDVHGFLLQEARRAAREGIAGAGSEVPVPHRAGAGVLGMDPGGPRCAGGGRGNGRFPAIGAPARLVRAAQAGLRQQVPGRRHGHLL